MKRLILPIACGICTVTSDAQTDKQPHPNVIFIYADDLGYTDLSCTGSRFYETPHIDKLAREGVCFTQSYAACPVSSPSRAALLTGKYPARINLTDYIPGERRNNDGRGLQAERIFYLYGRQVASGRVCRILS